MMCICWRMFVCEGTTATGGAITRLYIPCFQGTVTTLALVSFLLFLGL